MERITSVSNQLIKTLSSLNQKKNRIENNQFLVEGLHLVEEANKLNLLEMVLSTDEELLNKFNGKKYLVNELVIKKLSTTVTPQNIVGVVKVFSNDFEYVDKYIVLDGIQDPGNLGTIIRTSLALGVNHFILSEACVDIYNEKTIRATQGALFQAKCYYAKLDEVYPLLKQNGNEIIVTSLAAKDTLKTLTKPKKYALVVGNEANGITDISKNAADKAIIIPLKNNIESLNAAMALGIVLYNLEN